MSTTTYSQGQTRRRRVRPSRIATYALIYGLLILFALIFLFPFYTMFIGSFMQDNQLFSSSPNIWPTQGFQVGNYAKLFAELGYAQPLLNTFILAIVRTAGVLFFCSLAGFAFAKRRFPGRDMLFVVMLATMMLPTQITLIPWYLLMVKTLGWGNTYLPFWIPEWATAFGIFWMRQYIASTIPDEMMEAAAIDGCSVFGTFWRVVLPLIVPGMAVLGILNFVEGFNLFLGPLLILTDPEKIDRAAGLANFKGPPSSPPATRSCSPAVPWPPCLCSSFSSPSSAS
ncbi:MAG: carbohydrate ABC transporter permease [Caldilineaceae bacterium]